MLRHISRLLSIILIILILGFVAIFIILNTTLLTPTTNFLFSHWIHPNAHVEQVTYTAPNHFKFEQVVLKNDNQIESVDAWLSIIPHQLKQLEFDALLVSGMALTNDGLSALPIRKWKTKQLSLDNVSLTINQWHAEKADVQWINPIWKDNQILPDSQFQAHANTLIWDNQLQINDVLINGEYSTSELNLSGLSFKWNEARVEAQAKKTGDKWVIEDITIENLSIQDHLLTPELQTKIGQWTKSIDSVERFDLLRGQIQWGSTTFDNLELSATHLFPNQSLLWQQRDTAISLQADSIVDQDVLWTQPNIKLTLNPNSIDINDMSVGLSGGDIYLSAHFEPAIAEIHKLDIIAVKHAIEQEQPQYPNLIDYFQHLDLLYIEKLRVLNGQFIQLVKPPYWQLSGVNLEFIDSELIKDHKWGLWQGNVSASANNLSYDSVLATQAIIEMNSNGQQWNMPRLFIPFSIGYVSAQGKWQFGKNGKPWNIDIEADSLPLKLFKSWSLPLNVGGLLDVQLSANGLSGDETILRHTLSGSLDTSLRNGTFELSRDELMVTPSFHVENWQLKAKNGMITSSRAKVVGKEFYGVIQGEYDLSSTVENRGFSLSYEDNGHQKTLDILNSKPSE